MELEGVMMFNPFKLYDEMLGIYAETVLGPKDEQDVPMVTLEYDVPEDIADELDALICNWLASKGVEIADEDEDAS
jgi:hypothetical protein